MAGRGVRRAGHALGARHPSALDLEWVAAVLDYADQRLRLGQHADVRCLLATEADRRPLDERLAEVGPADRRPDHPGPHPVPARRHVGRLGEHAIALDYATEGLRLFEALDVPVSRAHALNQVGWISACLGSYGQARRSCVAALALFRDEHDKGSQANTPDSLGYIANETSNGDDAIDYYEQAIDLYRNVGDEYSEATAWTGSRAHMPYWAATNKRESAGTGHETIGETRTHGESSAVWPFSVNPREHGSRPATVTRRPAATPVPAPHTGCPGRASRVDSPRPRQAHAGPARRPTVPLPRPLWRQFRAPQRQP
jgi:tetratricopeptide (TPR) repeat protein